MLQTGLGRVDTILAALEHARPSVAAHSRRVAALSVRLALQYGLDARQVETVRLGALLHDVGKMLVPARILAKPTRPNRREWRELMIHPDVGMEIAHRSGFDDEVCGIVLYHHERWDGRGYPDGQRAHDIHFTVRIVSVMDAFDAVTSPRNYRERLTVDAAKSVLARLAGTRYCPWVVSALLSMPAPLLTVADGLVPQRYAPEGVAHAPGPEDLAPWRSLAGPVPEGGAPAPRASSG